MLAHRGYDVRVVVLDRDLRRLGPFKRVARRCVLRVEVVRDHLGPNAEQLLHVWDGSSVRRESFELVEISVVRAEISRVSRSQTEGVVQLRAAGQYGLRDGVRQGDWARNPSPRAAKHDR